MARRSSIFPPLFGLLVSVTVHLAVVLFMMDLSNKFMSRFSSNSGANKEETVHFIVPDYWQKKPEKKPVRPPLVLREPEEEEVVLGKDQKEDRPSKAWIAYDDVRKLIARASSTEQPALQNKVDPVKGGAFPRNPSPFPQRALLPREMQMAGTPSGTFAPVNSKSLPSPEPVEAERKIESQSPDAKANEKPIDQPKAEAEVVRPEAVTPRPQVPSQGPDQPGNPVNQPEAKTPKPDPAGEAGTQTAATPLIPIVSGRDPIVPAKSDGNENEKREAATSTVTLPTAKPKEQPRGETTQPTEGTPTQLAKAEAPPSTTGEPTKLTESKTPEPVKEGKPADVKPQPGADARETKPAVVTAGGVAAPRGNNERNVSPSPAVPPANATSAPRDESNVPPTILNESPLPMSPGGVITRRGIQIVAGVPDISTPSWLVSGPTAVNPIARITFNRDGTVRNVDLIRSTGHANLDSQVKTAFFNFKAKGEALQRVRETFTVEIKLLLKNELE